MEKQKKQKGPKLNEFRKFRRLQENYRFGDTKYKVRNNSLEMSLLFPNSNQEQLPYANSVKKQTDSIFILFLNVPSLMDNSTGGVSEEDLYLFLCRIN